ncbi:MAG: FAD-dependent oxidoreductase [Candidatus Bathyarchaeota archaeon]|jgi:heterodisulfide reductase subunit A-like polyferredoxin|nr:FAD-dependent oxidoreductase [Candidatus Bathyarchaeota archaeon]
MSANNNAKIRRLFPPCRVACPAHVNVQGYVSLLQRGKFKEAVELIREDMPFPAICGRVCFAPCEKACARKNVDQAVAIRSLKRIVADVEREQGRVRGEPIPIKYDKKIAIIGAGPAGLTAAYYLVKLGYPVIVFERMPEAGGMMRYRIPDSLLEKFVVANEVAYIQDLGVDIKYGVEFGKDMDLDTLRKEGYKAVFIAIGKLTETKSLPLELISKKSKAPMVSVDPITLETQIPGIFAGGDTIKEKPAGIIDAIGAGKRAAISIHRYLSDQDLKVGREEVEETTWIKNWEKIRKKPPRHFVKKGETKPRLSFEEAEKTLKEIKRKARFEAFRCLSCGPCAECLAETRICEIDKPIINKNLCSGCDICVSLCPFGAMSKSAEGIAQVDEKLCKGCGICAAQCPEKAITMEHLTNEQILSCILADFRR